SGLPRPGGRLRIPQLFAGPGGFAWPRGGAPMKAIRGAISVDQNTAEAIHDATCTLLYEIAKRNNLTMEDVVSIFFSVIPDLDAAFPATAARAMGWDVAMLDMQEMAVPGALPRCLRVLIHVDRHVTVRHAYLGDAS